jgi:Antibiotic biosynthesis monooxygenase
MSAAALATPVTSSADLSGGPAAPCGHIDRCLRILRADYATAPIEAGFDWVERLADTGSGTYFVVVFRSVRREAADAELLTEFDDRAHAEAQLSGGLHFYFKGEPDVRRACLSLCLWDSPEQARAALQLPRHQAAVRLAHDMYETFRLERYELMWDRSTGRADFRMV